MKFPIADLRLPISVVHYKVGNRKSAIGNLGRFCDESRLLPYAIMPTFHDAQEKK